MSMTPFPQDQTPERPEPQAPDSQPILALPRDLEEQIVKDHDELSDLYFEQLTPIWEQAAEHHRLYHADVEDPRTEEEKAWRAHIFPPKPKITTESKVSVMHDIITSIDPVIQVEGIGEEDEGGLWGERLLAYQLRGMKFRKRLPPFLRNVSIQGTEFFKLFWGRRAHRFHFVATQQDVDRFQKSLLDAEAAGIPIVADPIAEPQAFEAWRKMVNTSGKVKIPAPPLTGDREVRVYEGPQLARLSMFDVWLDPAVDEVSEQPMLCHRFVRTHRWLFANADNGEDPTKPFSAEAVARALDKNSRHFSHYSERHLRHQSRFYEIMGIQQTQTRDPLFDQSAEVFESFISPDGITGEYPYLVVCNGVIINKRPDQMPYMHGQTPIFGARNLTIAGVYHGLSDYHALTSIFMENAAFRNLRLDGGKLSMIPILAKLASVGVPQFLKTLKPGTYVPVPRMDAFTQLFKLTMPEGAWREPVDLGADIENATATPGLVQGQQAPFGRVPASETQTRFNSAISRLKLSASQLEYDFEDFAFQCLGLTYQFLDEEKRLRVGGPGDPYLDVSKDKILEAMNEDYRLLGATQAINREVRAQKLDLFGKTYGQHLTPVELRALMDEVIMSVGLRNPRKIVSEEGTKDAAQAYEIKKQAALMQAGQTLQGMQQQAAQAGAPGVVGAATARAMSSGGAGAPTEGAPPQPPPQAPPQGPPQE